MSKADYNYTTMLGDGVIRVYVLGYDIDWIIVFNNQYDKDFIDLYTGPIRKLIEEHFDTDSDEDLFEKIRSFDNQNIQVDLYTKWE